MRRLIAILLLLVAAPSFAATLSVTITDSNAAVDLPSVGTTDWRRWSTNLTGTTKAGQISTANLLGGTLRTYADDIRIIGDRRGVYVAGNNTGFQFTAPADTSSRTLTAYVGCWNTTARVTVTLPGATTFTQNHVCVEEASLVVRISYRGDSAGVVTVQHRQVVTGIGNVNLQAAALAVETVPVPPEPPVFTDSATLTWVAPTTNTDGSVLTDLSGFRVYSGKADPLTAVATINNPATLTYVVSGLTEGVWFFEVTALAGSRESARSNRTSKTVSAQCGAKPADETQTQQCAAPLVGSWTQTRTYTAAPAPTCWTPGPWSPTNPPAGACINPDPCVADPLTVSVTSWPNAAAGQSTFAYSTNKPATFVHEWIPQRATWTDTRGCSVTVSR